MLLSFALDGDAFCQDDNEARCRKALPFFFPFLSVVLLFGFYFTGRYTPNAPADMAAWYRLATSFEAVVLASL